MWYKEAVESIKEHTKAFKPKIGIIAGSGLKSLANVLDNKIVVPYGVVKNFVDCSVEGHCGEFHFGELGGVPVVCLTGRLHYYEGVPSKQIKLLIRSLHLLGCETLLITNAAGGIREDLHPGELMMITDHINFQSENVLIGPNNEKFGPRFVDMGEAYDEALREKLLHLGKRLQIDLKQGVYIGVSGPSFETPAEIKAFRIWGADAVGMSTVPEVILARHAGMRVVAVSAITNKAAGVGGKALLTHEETLRVSEEITKNLTTLVSEFVKNY